MFTQSQSRFLVSVVEVEKKCVPTFMVHIREGPFPNFFASGILKFGNGKFSGFSIPEKSGNRIFGNSVFPFGITEFSGFPNY